MGEALIRARARSHARAHIILSLENEVNEVNKMAKMTCSTAISLFTSTKNGKVNKVNEIRSTELSLGSVVIICGVGPTTTRRAGEPSRRSRRCSMEQRLLAAERKDCVCDGALVRPKEPSLGVLVRLALLMVISVFRGI